MSLESVRNILGTSAKFRVQQGVSRYVGTGYQVCGYGVSSTWVQVSDTGTLPLGTGAHAT